MTDSSAKAKNIEAEVEIRARASEKSRKRRTALKVIEPQMETREQKEYTDYVEENTRLDDVTLDYKIKCLHNNEAGDGQLYAYLQRGRYVYCVNSDSWLVWQGHYWEEDDSGRAISAVDDVANVYLTLLTEGFDGLDPDQLKNRLANIHKRVNRLRSKTGAEKCLYWASHALVNPLVVKGDELDSNAWLLACPNGVVDLKTGRMRPGEPEDWIKTVCPTKWEGLDASAPNWEKFLDDITDGNEELIDFLHRLFGYGITGLSVEHVLPIVRGRGRNGKGVLVSVLSSVLGEIAGPIRSEMLLDQGHGRSSAGPSPDIMALRSRRIAFASETDEGARFSASRVKWLTGADELVGRNTYDKHESRFRPCHRLILFTNRPPFAQPTDYAFFNRTAVINLPISFIQHRKPKGPFERKADKYLPEKLAKEAPGILAWLVRGCLKWQAEGLAQPKCIRDETERYRQILDYFGGFVEACCETGKTYEVKASDFYRAFECWYKSEIIPEENEVVPAFKSFSMKAAKYYDKDQRVHSYRKVRF